MRISSMNRTRWSASEPLFGFIHGHLYRVPRRESTQSADFVQRCGAVRRTQREWGAAQPAAARLLARVRPTLRDSLG
jgi:hypothetical protein